MSSQHDTNIDWPNRFERTPPNERTRSSKFSAKLGRTTDQIEAELDRMDVDYWRASIGNSHTLANSLPRHNANPDDPGFVLRWQDGGTDYAVACDQYARLRDNVRAVYLWLNETRMRAQRPVETGQDSFAAAALPAGDEDAHAVEPAEPPHEVLDLRPDAPDSVVKSAARAHKKDAHPDNGGSMEELQRIEDAEEAMLDE